MNKVIIILLGAVSVPLLGSSATQLPSLLIGSYSSELDVFGSIHSLAPSSLITGSPNTSFNPSRIPPHTVKLDDVVDCATPPTPDSTATPLTMSAGSSPHSDPGLIRDRSFVSSASNSASPLPSPNPELPRQAGKFVTFNWKNAPRQHHSDSVDSNNSSSTVSTEESCCCLRCCLCRILCCCCLCCCTPKKPLEQPLIDPTDNAKRAQPSAPQRKRLTIHAIALSSSNNTSPSQTHRTLQHASATDDRGSSNTSSSNSIVIDMRTAPPSLHVSPTHTTATSGVIHSSSRLPTPSISIPSSGNATTRARSLISDSDNSPHNTQQQMLTPAYTSGETDPFLAGSLEYPTSAGLSQYTSGKSSSYRMAIDATDPSSSTNNSPPSTNSQASNNDLP